MVEGEAMSGETGHERYLADFGLCPLYTGWNGIARVFFTSLLPQSVGGGWADGTNLLKEILHFLLAFFSFHGMLK